MNEIEKDMTTCLTYYIDEEPVYKILTTKLRDTYYLYKLKSGKYVKTKYQSDNPTDLYEYFKGGKK